MSIQLLTSIASLQRGIGHIQTCARNSKPKSERMCTNSQIALFTVLWILWRTVPMLWKCNLDVFEQHYTEHCASWLLCGSSELTKRFCIECQAVWTTSLPTAYIVYALHSKGMIGCYSSLQLGLTKHYSACCGPSRAKCTTVCPRNTVALTG